MRPDAHVVVTGGAGFIGSHLVERLLGEGRRVTVIDNLSTGSAENLAVVARHPRLTVVRAAVSQCPDLTGLVESADFLVHLAAAVGVELVVKSPTQTIQTNLDETEAVLEAARRRGTPVLLASTSEVYGKSRKAEFHEDDDLIIGPPFLGRWSYACSKLMDEFMAMACHFEHKLPVIITRFFNTVGPRQTGRYGMVLPRFIEAAAAGRPLRVYGDGQQSRCLCFVGDTVEALNRLLNNDRALGEVINIGGTEEITIQQLAERVRSLLGSDSAIEHVSYDQAYAPGFEDMLRRKPSVEKLHKLTGFKPATPLDEIIRLTAAG